MGFNWFVLIWAMQFLELLELGEPGANNCVIYNKYSPTIEERSPACPELHDRVPLRIRRSKLVSAFKTILKTCTIEEEYC